MKGGWKRMRAGLPLIMMRAQGPGHIAFSADQPGETLAVPLHPGQVVDVVEHRFLVATGNVAYEWDRLDVWFTTRSGDDTEWHYPVGQYDRPLRARRAALACCSCTPRATRSSATWRRGERILVQPGGLIWKDQSVGMFLHFEYPRGAYWFSSARWQAKMVWLTLQGPGRIAVQSVFERPETVGSVQKNSGATSHQW